MLIDSCFPYFFFFQFDPCAGFFHKVCFDLTKAVKTTIFKTAQILNSIYFNTPNTEVNIQYLIVFLSQPLGEFGNQRPSCFSKKSTGTAVRTDCNFSIYPMGMLQLNGNTDDKILWRIRVICIKASRVEALYHILTLAHHLQKGSADAHRFTFVTARWSVWCSQPLHLPLMEAVCCKYSCKIPIGGSACNDAGATLES